MTPNTELSDEKPTLPGFIRRRMEQAINASANPQGMGIHNGKVYVHGSDLAYMLKLIDALSPTSPPIGKTEGDAEGVKASSESQPTGEEFNVANRLLDILMREAHGTTVWPEHWMEVRGQLLAAIRNAGVNPSRGGEQG